MMANYQTRLCLIMSAIDLDFKDKVEAAFTYIDYMRHDYDWVDQMYIETESLGGE